MESIDRYGMWLINNIKFDGIQKSITLKVEGKDQKLIFTNYENASKLNPPFKKWITETIPRYHNINHPLFTKSIFVFTDNPNQHSKPWDFLLLVKLCLRLVFYKPTIISHPFEWINNSPSTGPSWEAYQPNIVSKRQIDDESLSKLVEYYEVLSKFNTAIFNPLEEVMQISAINDVIYEVMLLWSFIEGFWNEIERNSKLDKSLINMLTKDFAPGKTKRDPEIYVVRQKILSQNELIGAKKYSELRNIIAHGWFLSKEDSWSNEQWKAIYEQRDLLVETLTQSLINRICRKSI